MKKLKKVLIMAGGTGGHVFPGLAIAKHFQQHGIEIVWLGTAKGLEARLVPAAHIPLHLISIGGVRGKGLKSLLLLPIRLSIAIFQAMRIIRQLQPDLIIGMGGFVSGPGGIASGLLGYPLVIHEQNARVGTTNRWLSWIAKKNLEGFPNTFSARKKAFTVGNPVRKELEKFPSPEQRFAVTNPHRSLRILILGGSLGAQVFNRLLPEAFAQMPLDQRPEVHHQTGEKHLEETVAYYALHDVKATIAPFIANIAEAYSWADIIVCRAGALTLAELCAVGLGAILVPFPHAIDDHQTANARYLAQQGAAWLVQQKDLTGEKLVQMLQQLANNPEERLKMAMSAYKLRQINVADKILRICEGESV